MPTNTGQQVPLSTVVSIQTQTDPNALTHYNQLNSATFQAVPMPGVTVGQAVDFLEGVAKKLPTGFSHDYLADSRHFHFSSFFLQRGLRDQVPNLFSKLKSAGLSISLDTNDDPDDRWDGLENILRFVDVFLPNSREAQKLSGLDDLPAAMDRLANMVPLVVVKAGADGALARRLELPSTGWLRRYKVRVHGEVEPERLAVLDNGVTIDGLSYGPIRASLERRQGSNAWIAMALREGKNREVRHVLEHLGLTVTRLLRLSYGPFQLGNLPRGAVAEVPKKVLSEQLGNADRRR